MMSNEQMQHPPSASASILLGYVARGEQKRPRVRRLLIASAVCTLLFVFVALTKSQFWPQWFPFSLIYWGHDSIYLPIKGWTWSSWYPWCLILWLPVWGIAVAGLWAWVTGIEPSRALQRLLIVSLLRLRQMKMPTKRTIGTRWFALTVKLSQMLGLKTAFIETVVEHEVTACLEKLETDCLAGRFITSDMVRRALVLIDVDIELFHMVGDQRDEKRLALLLDIAFLTHFSDLDDQTFRHSLAQLIDLKEGQQAQGPNRYQLLADGLDARRLANSMPDIGAVITAMDQLALSASLPSSKRRAVLPQEVSIPHMLEEAVFAFYGMQERNWGVAASTVLASIERLWSALVLSEDYQAEAEVLAWWMRRSRIAMLRNRHENRWLPALNTMPSELWPSDHRFYWAMDGTSLAAGSDM